MKNNSRKFLLEAGERDVRIFESVAGDVLDALGYDRVYVRKGEELRFTDAEIADFNAENARLKGRTAQARGPRGPHAPRPPGGPA